MTTDSQRQKYLAWVGYRSPGGGPVKMRLLPCFTCREAATRGCVKHGHLVGEPVDVLPPFRLEVKS